MCDITPLSPSISSFFISSGMITSCKSQKTLTVMVFGWKGLWMSFYLDSLLMAVALQCTAAVLRECRHVQIEGRRSALPFLKKVYTVPYKHTQSISSHVTDWNEGCRIMRHTGNGNGKGGNEGFTYMRTWSGSAKMRELQTNKLQWESKTNT